MSAREFYCATLNQPQIMNKGNLEAYRACQHLQEYRSMQGLRGFRVVQKCLWQSGCSPGRWSIKEKEQTHVPICTTCRKSISRGGGGGRLYACLICANINCNTHLRLHSHTKAGHTIAVDLERAELYCSTCNDQVYDPDFDRLVLLSSSSSSSTPCQEGGDDEGKRESVMIWGCRKRRKIAEYKAWVAGPIEKTLIRQRATRLNCAGEGERWPWGLRGLNNLGNSCFMNCVLQTFLHTPPLRNYFLSDRHNRAFCHHNKNGCITCDMDDIFSASFSGDRTPYSPARFLYSWWQHAANFAGYEQQDAHDFFISTVDGIHANYAISLPKSRQSQKKQCNAGSVECRCIVHKVFSGVLRSDVICTVCNSTSTTYDPCLDISLDLEPSTVPLNNLADLSVGNLRGDLLQKSHITGTSTLLGCLDRFTRPERLGSNEKFYCKHCQTRQESIKQMSVKKLPLVLCFHIKRFEHSTTQHTSKKVDRYMQFPFSLDMAPYMSSFIVRMRYGNRILTVEPNVGMPLMYGKPPSEYDLFAVVTHSGGMDSGHYVAFLRRGGNWYKCDDAWINQVSEQAVRASQGYMLYYVQKTFHYGTSESEFDLKFCSRK